MQPSTQFFPIRGILSDMMKGKASILLTKQSSIIPCQDRLFPFQKKPLKEIISQGKTCTNASNAIQHMPFK